MQDERLSEHFLLSEFTKSATAKAKGIDNSPTLVHKNTLKHTANYLLEPLRRLYNAKYNSVNLYKGKLVKEVIIRITSGYRSAKLNKAIPNSSKTSEHCIGAAVDIDIVVRFFDGTSETIPFTEVYQDIKKWVRNGNLSVNQCIQEQSGDAKWVHVSHHPSGKTCDKREFLVYKNGRYYRDNS